MGVKKSVRRVDWLTAREIRAAITPPAGRPDSLLLLLEAARIPNTDVIAFAAQELANILDRCPWICIHGNLLPAPRLIPQLKTVAGCGAGQQLQLQYGSKVPEFFVLGDGESRLPGDAHNLVGILLLMRLMLHAELGASFNKTEITELERVIRGRTQSPSRYRFWRSVGALAEPAESLTQLQNAIRTLLSDPDSGSQRELELFGRLSRWIEDFLRFREKQLKTVLNRRGQLLLTNIAWPLDDGEDGERPLGGPLLIPPLTGIEGEDRLSDQYREALASQSTRTRNLLFHSVHPEVLLPAQAEAVIALGLKHLCASKTRSSLKAKWVLTLLTAATGRMPGLLGVIRFSDSDSALAPDGGPLLNVSTGILYLPPAIPPNIHRPDRSDARFDHPADAIPLPLPPKLVAAICELRRSLGFYPVFTDGWERDENC